jgi:hypothetical protein
MIHSNPFSIRRDLTNKTLLTMSFPKGPHPITHQGPFTATNRSAHPNTLPVAYKGAHTAPDDGTLFWQLGTAKH